MAVTLDQALAFIDVLTSAKPVRISAEAILGLGKVPELKDFQSNDAETLDRVEEFLGYVDENLGAVWASLEGRARQAQFDFMKEEKPNKTKSKGKAKAKSKSNNSKKKAKKSRR